jgi:hypothetical protein
MMGLTDRVEPWTRRFQRTAATAAPRPGAGSATRASLRARPDVEPEALEHRSGRFTRRALQEQER